MKVYILKQLDLDGDTIAGVYSQQKDAIDMKNSLVPPGTSRRYDNYIIEEHEVIE